MSTTTSPRKKAGARKLAPAAIAAFVLGALIALLAILNLDRVPVDLLFGTVDTPLILLIAICVLVGALLGAAATGGAVRRHRR